MSKETRDGGFVEEIGVVFDGRLQSAFVLHHRQTQIEMRLPCVQRQRSGRNTGKREIALRRILQHE